MVALKPFLNDAFAGRIDLAAAFLFQAVEFEYGAFLGELTASAAPAPTKQA
jgi:hypothetical protein